MDDCHVTQLPKTKQNTHKHFLYHKNHLKNGNKNPKLENTCDQCERWISLICKNKASILSRQRGKGHKHQFWKEVQMVNMRQDIQATKKKKRERNEQMSIMSYNFSPVWPQLAIKIIDSIQLWQVWKANWPLALLEGELIGTVVWRAARKCESKCKTCLPLTLRSHFCKMGTIRLPISVNCEKAQVG